MKPQRVLIVGATGRVGGEVLRRLDRDRFALRALVRDARSISSLPGGIEACVGDLRDTAKLAVAVRDVDCVFVAIRDCPEQVELENNLIDVARAGGVERFVKVSAFAAGLEPPPGYGAIHAKIETRLTESDLAYTILRPYMYMQNFLDVASAIRGPGLIPFPLGRCRVAFIDARDVARVATAVVAGAVQSRQTLVLTGPRSLSLRDCAQVFSDTLARKVRAASIPQWLANLAMRRAGVGPWDIRMRSELFRMLREGGESQTTDTVQRIIGETSKSLTGFVTDHRDNFA